MLEREDSLGSSQRRGGSEGAPPDLPLSQRSRLSSTSDQDGHPNDGSAVLTAINTHKRTKSNTSADSETVSPTNRHLQKRARETFTSDMQESSSPSLPSSPPSYPRRMTPSSPSQLTVEDTSPTPEKRGTLSPSYEPPSSPYTTNGGLSARKVREISDVAGGFTARVFTLQLEEGNNREAPLLILGLIALASLAKHAETLRMSEKWVNLNDFQLLTD
ncbi:90bd8242-9a93-46d7-ae9e-0cc0d17aa020 [Sclerotinia trifoliorum]|uniref:90bd8242-9a93-46d7-ae9e-0cc0d17aa020 n=1 Tax=Sclerotinia trifoliorum TaxID=28548 RepID=A0A8H2VMB8_9HELO|nr:90bd8242-9a93-46d7-ae9e-0cc0d17aa020 [Sclerotinia trifoliorum]